MNIIWWQRHQWKLQEQISGLRHIRRFGSMADLEHSNYDQLGKQFIWLLVGTYLLTLVLAIEGLRYPYPDVLLFSINLLLLGLHFKTWLRLEGDWQKQEQVFRRRLVRLRLRERRVRQKVKHFYEQRQLQQEWADVPDGAIMLVRLEAELADRGISLVADNNADQTVSVLGGSA